MKKNRSTQEQIVKILRQADQSPMSDAAGATARMR